MGRLAFVSRQTSFEPPGLSPKLAGFFFQPLGNHLLLLVSRYC